MAYPEIKVALDSELNSKAWDLYCRDTAGDMDVKDFWEDLPEKVQLRYVAKVLDSTKLSK